MKFNEEVLAAIKKRRSLERPLISLRDILKAGGIEESGYLKMCADRIAEVELIDAEEVQIDFLNFPDLHLTADGLKECQGVLENYIPVDVIKRNFSTLCVEESRRESVNMLAEKLRDLRLIELFEMYYECKEKEIRKFIVAEAYHRSIFVGMQRVFYEGYINLLMKIKYRHLLNSLKIWGQNNFLNMR